MTDSICGKMFVREQNGKLHLLLFSVSLYCSSIKKKKKKVVLLNRVHWFHQKASRFAGESQQKYNCYSSRLV